MLRFIKLIYNKASEAFVKFVGIVTLVFSFMLTLFGKYDINKRQNAASSNINSSIIIEISHINSAGYKNVVELYFKSSSTITISRIKVRVGNYIDELSGDSLIKYEGNQWHIMAGYEGVELGQEWTITFYGIEVLSNKKFVTTTKYVVNQ